MTHTYQITGMTCSHCAEKVKKALEQVDGVQSAKVTLDPPEATLTLHHHIP
ncbi:MAG: heavy-metal-associated domain-containing protein, partial [Phaeodactylibacter sp.]|nr:heavy-metal-associated domain-containing protein [Phaeodactylibacter sp.]